MAKEKVELSTHRVVMHLNKGGLHRALGIKEGEKIPEARIQASRNSSNPHVAKMAYLANTMAGWKK